MQFQENYTIKTEKNLKFFWLGFILYSAAFAYGAVDIHNYKIAIPTQIVGICLFTYNAIRLIRLKIPNRYLLTLFLIYCGWLCVIIFRGFEFDYQFFKDSLFDAEKGIFIYCTPLIMLFPITKFFFKKLFQAILSLSIIFIVYDIFFIKNILNVKDYFYDVSNTKYTFEYLTKILSVPIGFMLLTYRYHSGRVRLLSFFVVLVTVFFALYRARRGLLFSSVSPIIVAFIFYLRSQKMDIAICLLLVLGLSVASVFGLRKSSGVGMFNLLTERVDEDTRTPVENCLFDDMSTKDWIFGRGVNGQYYCPNIDQNDITGYRTAIETDYLNIILKGGIISLALLILITIPAIINGFFYSNNSLTKAAACWIVLWIFSLYPTTVYTFSLNHLLVWISVGICYNRGIRQKSDSDIKFQFLNWN